MRSVFIFLPDVLNYTQESTLRGFVKESDNTLSFYVLTDTSSPVIGVCNDAEFQPNKAPPTQIHIHCKTGQISLNAIDNCNITCIMYDYVAFNKCDVSTFNCNDYGEHFSTLTNAVQNERSTPSMNGHSFSLALFYFVVNLFVQFLNILDQLLERSLSLLRFSATVVHFHETVDTLKFAMKSLKRKQKVTLVVGNIITSRIADFLCGLFLLYFMGQHRKVLVQFVYDTTESIIEALEQLLRFLMGSPAGLKLNSTFNLTLGTFFSYHVTLWRAFLQATSPLLSFMLYLLVFPGACGLSFQAALLTDLIALNTFHIYCIYVYAARLYGVQIKGLVSLWRLFIGRKYNPLRSRVDSHQYTHNQLFIGTLVFTILLFLFPTTFLYYAVFTMLRITLTLLNGILLRLRYCFQCFPVYMIVLWLSNSSSIRGAVKLSLVDNATMEACRIHASLLTLPFWQSVKNTIPKTLETIKPVAWKDIFGAIVMGSLI